LKVVLKVGGHLFPEVPALAAIAAYGAMLRDLQGLGHRVVVVTGGGRVARTYIEAARGLGASEVACDQLGIEVSRLNARLVIATMGEAAYPEPVTTLSQLVTAFTSHKVVVVGGLQPGQSTNAVGILAAEAVHADLLLNATDVDGVYTADPAEDALARKLTVVRTDELLRLLLAKELWAGSYALFDPVAIKLVERSRIPTRIIDGRDPATVVAAVQGAAVGTLIVSAAP